MKTIVKRQMTFIGHIYRHRNLEHLVLTGRFPGSKTQGRPRKTLMDNVTTWTGLNRIELFRAMDDRSYWSVVVADAVNRQGR